MNVRIRIEFGGDASRNRVELNARSPRAWVQTFRHEAEEMADTQRGFKYVTARLESKSLHGLPDGFEQLLETCSAHWGVEARAEANSSPVRTSLSSSAIAFQSREG